MNQVALFLGRLLFVALVPASPTLLAEDLLPEADGTVRGGRYADAANIPGQSLVVKNSRFAEFDRWSYLKFDLSKVDAEIVRATLVLSVRHTDGTTTLDVHATHDRWDPRNVRWNRRPVPDAAVATATVRDDRDIILDVTDYVRAEARGDRAASFVLSVPHANERYLSFGSRKSQAAPLLMIDTRASFASGHRQPPRATVPVRPAHRRS
mgnify:FL=1